jgi:hypothetical protein
MHRGDLPELSDADRELLKKVAAYLTDLGPFDPGARRHEKWRTTEQLAAELRETTCSHVRLDELDRVLGVHEAAVRSRLERGLLPAAQVRRATYPDRTTALHLWGSTKHHGQPWLTQAPVTRMDDPTDLPAELRVADAAPHVFLSHTQRDGALALDLAHSLASLGIGSWMFESHIEERGPIAQCVRKAIAETAGCLALVTRESIASLWVLTELHTALEGGRPVSLVVDATDEMLLQLLESVRFSHERRAIDSDVKYDEAVLQAMHVDYARCSSATRASRYVQQARDFLATLPVYLSGGGAFALPGAPASWHGTIAWLHLRELPGRLSQ